LDGVLHRGHDLPAVVYTNGDRLWYQHNVLHREGGPAIVRANGSEEWYVWGLRHRAGGLPALTLPTGQQFWFEMGTPLARPSQTEPPKLC
jgi:hypothetical protein